MRSKFPDLLRQILLAAGFFFLSGSQAAFSGSLHAVRLRYLRPLDAGGLISQNIVPRPATVLLREGTHLWTSDGTHLLAFNRFSGKTEFSLDLSGDTGQCIGYRNDKIYACGSNGELLATDARGQELWRTSVDEPLGDNIYMQASCLLVSGRTGSLWCFDWESGRLLWKETVDLPVDRQVAPVVQFARSSQEKRDLLWWLYAGVLNSARIGADGLEVLRRVTVGNDRFLSAGAPQADGSIWVPASRGKSRFLASKTDQTPEELPGALLPVDLWKDEAGKALEIEWGAIDPLRGLVHLGSRGLPDGISPWEGEAPVAVVWNGTHPFLALYSDGRIKINGQEVGTPRIAGIASNVLVAPSRKLQELDLYFVSSHGWLYRYTVPAAEAMDQVGSSR